MTNYRGGKKTSLRSPVSSAGLSNASILQVNKISVFHGDFSIMKNAYHYNLFIYKNILWVGYVFFNWLWFNVYTKKKKFGVFKTK